MVFRTLIFIFLVLPFSIQAQYKWYPAPDIWYNYEDGVRLGLRLKGKELGYFDNSPNKIDFGIWMGSKWPDNPISYFFKYSNPLITKDELANDITYGISSQYRVGYENYSAFIQNDEEVGFIDSDINQLHFEFGYEDFYSTRYALLKTIIPNKETIYAGLTIAKLRSYYQYWFNYTAFYSNQFSFKTELNLHVQNEFSTIFSLITRIRSVLNTSTIPIHRVEFLSVISQKEVLLNPFFSADGTIPIASNDNLIIHPYDGAGVRAFLSQDFKSVSNNPYLTNVLITAQNDVNFASLITRQFKKIQFIGDIFDLKHYAFWDVGYGLIDYSTFINSIWASGGGLGFSLEMTDQKPNDKLKAFSVKYELPFWRLSNKKDNNGLYLQNLIQIGGTINF